MRYETSKRASKSCTNKQLKSSRQANEQAGRQSRSKCMQSDHANRQSRIQVNNQASEHALGNQLRTQANKERQRLSTAQANNATNRYNSDTAHPPQPTETRAHKPTNARSSEHASRQTIHKTETTKQANARTGQPTSRPMHHNRRTEEERTEKNRTEQNRTEQNRKAQNEIEQKRTEQTRTEGHCRRETSPINKMNTNRPSILPSANRPEYGYYQQTKRPSVQPSSQAGKNQWSIRPITRHSKEKRDI